MRRHLRLGIALALLIAMPALQFGFTTVQAKGLSHRKLVIGTNIVGATTTYEFDFDVTDTSDIGSISFEVCNNSALPEEPCVAPPGFDFSASNLINQTGETGFTIDSGSRTSNYILLTRASAAPILQPVSYTFDNVVNPTDTNRTYYVRLQTFTASDGSGTAIEKGGVAASTSGELSVGAYVPPFLEFCVGISITGNDCSTASGDLIDFGVFSDTSPSVGTSQMAGATNGSGGLAITVIGTTMTSGVNTIDPLTVRSASAPGTNQFGINLRANTAPTAGIDPSGSGTTVPVGDYNIPNQFAFRTGDTIASSALPTNYNTLTVTYLINRLTSQSPGIYTSTITYVASATF